MTDFLSYACASFAAADAASVAPLPPFAAWNATEHNLTPCFVDLVLVATPSALVLISSVFFLCCASNSRRRRRRFWSLDGFATASLSLLPPASVFVDYLANGVAVVTPMGLACRSLCGVAWCSSILSAIGTRRRFPFGAGIFSSFARLLLLLSAAGVVFWSLVTLIGEEKNNNDIDAIFLLFYAAFLFVLLIRDAVDDCRDSGVESSEESASLLSDSTRRYESIPDASSSSSSSSSLPVAEKASIFSRAFFLWVFPLLRRGEEIRCVDDVFLPPENLNLRRLEEKMMEEFEVERKARTQRAERPTSLELHVPASDDPATSDSRLSRARATPTSVPNAFRVFLRLFGLEFFLVGFLRFIAFILLIIGPIIQNRLLLWMQDPVGSSESWTTSWSWGYALAALLMIDDVCMSLVFTQFRYHIRKLALKVRSTTALLIFRKLLSLRTPARSKFSSGSTINLVSTDCVRIETFVNFFHDLWVVPICILQVIYLLYQQIGLAFLASVGYIILSAPLGHIMSTGWYKFGWKEMKQKDRRIKMMREILSGINVIKFQSWESAFLDKIKSIRDSELLFLRKAKIYDGCSMVYFQATPTMMAVLAFATFAITGNAFTAARIFTSLSLFNILIDPLLSIPRNIGIFIEAKISYHRINKFLNLPENQGILDEEEEDKEEEEEEGADDVFRDDVEDLIRIRDADFSWEIDDGVSYADVNEADDSSKKDEEQKTSPPPEDAYSFSLTGVDFFLKAGEFIGVVGAVGAGKSSLLSALLGDLTLIRGAASLSPEWRRRPVALVAQESWLQQATIKENVLFGRDFRPAWFEEVLRVCQMDDDVALFPAGVDTEIGENGVTLSGGQKARVALARAVYADADVLFIDDPFAAVDPDVAEKIFDECVDGVLRRKTRILCTHHEKFLRKADRIVVVEDGRVSRVGSPDVILRDEELEETFRKRERMLSLGENPVDDGVQGEAKLVDDEDKRTGVVDFKVWWAYISYTGKKVGVFVICAIVAMHSLHICMDIWMVIWVRMTYAHPNATLSNETAYNETLIYFDDEALDATNSTPWFSLREPSDNLYTYLAVYFSLFIIQFITTISHIFVIILAGIECSRRIHEALLRRVLAAPLRFFSSTPVGRILNRFSTDLADVDDHLSTSVSIAMQETVQMTLAVLVTAYAFPWVLLVLIPNTFLLYKVQKYFRRSSREVKRVEAISRSPILSHLTDCLKGVTTIQAMREERRFVTSGAEKIAALARAEFSGVALQAWMYTFIGSVGSILMGGVAFTAVMQRQFGDGFDEGLAGFSLTYALVFGLSLKYVIMGVSITEKMMVGVERILQYTEETPLEEEEEDVGADLIPERWPDRGVVRFEDVRMRYRADLAPALDGMTFSTAPAEKVGIVGRTGSGKSSIFNVLFRVETIEGGRVLIDDVDISMISRHLLRSRLAIIPQDPYVFSGTVRQNIDVDASHDDAAIWSALEKCHLKEDVREMGGLDAEVPESGACFSVGQKQLLCLARALVKRTKILCIDEATANVDFDTDKRIQDTLRNEFVDCTVLTIAHRTETLAEADSILEISRGRVISKGPPREVGASSREVLV